MTYGYSELSYAPTVEKLNLDFIRKIKETKFMENTLTIFKNPEFGKIRTEIINGEPWFVGKDVAEALSYSNSSKAISMHVDNEDKKFLMMDIADSQNGNAHKGKTKTAFINESGLYGLIFGSKLKSAKRFKHWVTSEVLPTLRKTGSYIMTKQDSYIINDPVKRAERWIEEEKERQRLSQENQSLRYANKKLDKNNKNLKKENSDMKPKAKFHDAVATSAITEEEAISIGMMAGILCQEHGIKIGEKRLFEYLRNCGYLCSASHVWNKPKQKMIENGYMLFKEGWDKTERKPTYHPLITGKGQTLIVKRIMKDECFQSKRRKSKYYFPTLPY